MRKIKSLFGFFKKNEPKRTANLKKNAKVVNASPDTKMRDVERKKEALEAVCDEMTVEVKDVPSEKQLKNEVESNVQPEAATNDEGLKAQIYNLIIVDESGSMSHLRDVTLSGINETIGTIRSAQKEFAETQEHTLTLVTFDSCPNRADVRTMIDNCPIDKVKEFRDYMPNGCTPLYDAMGQSLTKLHAKIKNNVKASAVVTVLTDGLENASKEWDASGLRRLIEQLKDEGWSFSYMGSAHNVKEVTDLLSIENVVEFSHDDFGADNTWHRERSSRRAYYRKMNMMYCSNPDISEKDLQEKKRQFANEYYSPRVTPENIRTLKENEIFVFGSNIGGFHGGGAAAFAMRNFGAAWGQGEGIQGRSYAIPTMEGIEQIKESVGRFTDYASEHPELRFLVTRIGCGVAGHTFQEIAPLFKDCIGLENVALPSEFWDVLGLKMY
jgi:hypothetical protein